MYEPLGVQLTHILKTIFRGGKDMSKRTVCLILGLFLLSYIPATDFFEGSEKSSGTHMDDKIERIEISPNPNSITDLGAPIITDSSESSRSEIIHILNISKHVLKQTQLNCCNLTTF